jgi:hypothetical protein
MGVSVELEHAVHVRSYPGSPRGGDLGLVIPSEDGALAALIDATGHGLASYAVAMTARGVIVAQADQELGAIFAKLDVALKGTLGAAVSIARIARDGVTFAGVGNVAAYIDLHPLVGRVGIVGGHGRPPPLARAALAPDAWLLMHTDGVRRPDAIPRGDAAEVAAALVRTHGVTHDDAAVLALRWRRAPAPP